MTKQAKELIVQNLPQDVLQIQATLGLVFAKKAAETDVTGNSSRWQQADSGSKKAGLVTLQGAQQGAKMARNRIACLSFLWYLVARGKRQEKSHWRVGSARASPLAFCPVVSQPRCFCHFPKMARNTRYAFFVTMTLGHAWQVAAETLTVKLGMPELAPLLSA